MKDIERLELLLGKSFSAYKKRWGLTDDWNVDMPLEKRTRFHVKASIGYLVWLSYRWMAKEGFLLWLLLWFFIVVDFIHFGYNSWVTWILLVGFLGVVGLVFGFIVDNLLYKKVTRIIKSVKGLNLLEEKERKVLSWKKKNRIFIVLINLIFMIMMGIPSYIIIIFTSIIGTW